MIRMYAFFGFRFFFFERNVSLYMCFCPVSLANLEKLILWTFLYSVVYNIKAVKSQQIFLSLKVLFPLRLARLCSCFIILFLHINKAFDADFSFLFPFFFEKKLLRLGQTKSFFIAFSLLLQFFYIFSMMEDLKSFLPQLLSLLEFLRHVYSCFVDFTMFIRAKVSVKSFFWIIALHISSIFSSMKLLSLITSECCIYKSL